jgi:23S rRNA (pseudouridine1915-N3)-methyltransferase
MRIGIIAVGRAKRGPESELFEFYRNRIAWPCALIEVEEKRKLPTDQRIAREAELIEERIPGGAVTVALDERGDDPTSRELAAKFRDWEDGGVSDVVFMIGGADGLAPALRDAARLRLRFGRMTWPHMLVRPMLAEQIYRCRQILDGHPYHRD